MRDDVRNLLIELYGRTCRWQTAKGIRIELTQEQFIAKWSKYRLTKFEKLLDKGRAAVLAYLRNPEIKPVCGWRTSENREGGVMTDANTRIMPASEQRKLFQFKKGDKHSDESREKMRKPKSETTREKMKASAKERWARERAAKAAEKGETK